MTWLKTNWQTVVALAGALWTIFSFVNGLVKNPEAKSFLGKLLDLLSYIKRADAPGSVKLPFTRSAPKKTDDADKKPGSAGAVPTASITIPLIIFVLSAAACAGATAWSNCELGKLPQVSQTAIPTVVQILQQDDQATAVQQLEGLGLGLLPGQISCIVQAIVADETARAALVKGMRARHSVNMVRNGQAFLAKYPATCCTAPVVDGGAQ